MAHTQKMIYLCIPEFNTFPDDFYFILAKNDRDVLVTIPFHCLHVGVPKICHREYLIRMSRY